MTELLGSLWNSLWNIIDLAPVDALNIGCTVFFPLQRWIRGQCGFCEKPHILMLFMDFCRGATFFPFVLIVVGVFATSVLKIVLDLNKGALFMAGVIGAVSVVKVDRWLIDYLKDQARNLTRATRRRRGAAADSR